MFATKTLKLVPQVAQQSTRQMQSSVVSGPPRVKISPLEKLAHGLAIAIGISAVPAWVLVNIKHYKAPAK